MLITGIILTILIRTITINKELLTWVIIGIMIISIIIDCYSLNQEDRAILGGLYHTNYMINIIEIGILIISIAGIILMINSELGIELRIILLCSVLGQITLINSYDILSTYLSIELLTLTLYVITTISRYSATAAGLKYYILGCMSSALLLFGFVLLYSITGLTQFDALALLSSLRADSLHDMPEAFSGMATGWTVMSLGEGMNIAIIIIIIALLFKIGAAPFHYWAPDIYDNTPTIITSWIAIMGKYPILSLLIILKTSIYIPYQSNTFITNTWLTTEKPTPAIITLIIGSALTSLVIGSILGLVQKKIKRLLAYSTITHLGYLLIALTIEGAVAVNAFCFYLLQYWFTFYNMFSILIKLELSSPLLSSSPSFPSHSVLPSTVSPISSQSLFPDPTITMMSATTTQPQTTDKGNISAVKPTVNTHSISLNALLYNVNPATVTAIIITLFSLTGIPPLIGFFGKIMIINITLFNGYYLASLLIILTSVISAVYYLNLILSSLLPSPPLSNSLFSALSYPSPTTPTANTIPSISETPTSQLLSLKNVTIRPTYLQPFTRPLSWIISIITLIITFYLINTTIFIILTHILTDSFISPSSFL